MREIKNTDTAVREAENILADLEAIEQLGYPTQCLRITSEKIEMHLRAVQRHRVRPGKRLGQCRTNWHVSWITTHCDTYRRQREGMI